MIPIFITTWNRQGFLERVLTEIEKKTEAGSYSIHVFDNGSNRGTQQWLADLVQNKQIESVHLHASNTGCLFSKKIFHAMVPDDCDYFCITDNDFIPPVGWLPKLLKIMDANPKLAAIAPFYSPYWPMGPITDCGDYLRAAAVGNTFTIFRRKAYAMIQHEIPQAIGAYGDDGMYSRAVRAIGWEVGIARDVFTYNLEITQPLCGYTEKEWAQDPRKAGYSEHQRYEPIDWETLEPPDHLKWKPNE